MRIRTSGRNWEVLRALTVTEIRDERDLTPIGMVKWLVEPLAYTAMYVLLVGVMLRRGQHAYPLFLLCALLPWRYFQQVVSTGMNLVSGYSNLITARDFDRRLLPLVPVASEGATFGLGLVLLPVAMAYYRIVPTPALLWLPAIVLVTGLVMTGPVFLSAVFGLYFPDWRGVAQSLLRAGFLASTGLVAARKIPGTILPAVIRANPLSGIFDSYRDVFMFSRAPEFWNLVYPALVGAGVLALGLAVYSWRQDEFAKEV